MTLDPYRDLIANLPVRQQAFTSKRTTWQHHVQRMPPALVSVFGGNTAVSLSRGDLFAMADADESARFIYGVILWGYPAGMRGTHFPSLVANFRRVERIVKCIKDRGNEIADWAQHWRERFEPVVGLGLGLATKILYFSGTHVNGLRCLILDGVLVKIIRSGKFDEFAELQQIRDGNAPGLYPTYLKLMHREARRLDVQGDHLEMFLFIFGPVLKDEP